MSVTSSYAYHRPAGGSQDVVPFADIGARMAKRRRIGSGEEYGREQSQQQHPYAPHPFASFTQHTGTSDYASTTTAGGGVATYDSAGASTLTENNDPSTQWNGSAASTYPDVASYSQQPYFFPQTDPSTYNSRWPPAESASFGTQTNNYSATAQSNAMPYFPPTQSAPEVSLNTFDTSTQQSFQNYQQDSEPLPAQQHYSYGQSNNNQSRGEVQASQGALYFEDASMHLKIQSLPILDNLATQLIHTIAKASFPQLQEIMGGTDTEDSQAYTTLKNLFDQTRKVYSRETPFIDAIAIQMFQPSQQETIRKANIATFISSILGAHDVSFFHLNEFFMETFVPLGHRLLKWQGAIYLELKTQTYISALINSDGNPEAMLDELFPSDLDAQILSRHPDAPSLSPSEQDFIDRSRARKSYLLAEDALEEALRELPKKYHWYDFVREFASCISKNVDGIMNVPTRTQASLSGSAADRRANAVQALNDTLGRNAQQSQAGANSTGGIPGVQSLALGLSLNDRNAQSGAGGQRDTNDSSKKAITAASTIRQPWTKPEEDSLLSGLGQVNGPHWSQILALYGRGGSISEVLKDRNQVQLKDKARNLKLWYLKMGKDVPPALRGVTGELRKRGGARARAALGMADDENADDMDPDGEAEGEGIAPNPESSQSRGKGSAKKKTKKGG